eukprot:Skav233659  [mRNA]  locus=scaffold2779:1098587:1099573:- [translate_table: standard]
MAAHGTVATIQSYTSATDFLRDATEIFAKREVEHSFMLGVLGNLQKDMDFYRVTPQLLAVKGSASAPVLLATMVYPNPLVLSLAAPSASDEDVTGALQCLVDYVATVFKEQKVFPLKLLGLPALVDPFAARLAKISGEERLRPGMHMQFYSVDPSTLAPPRLQLEDDPSLTVRPYEDRDAEWMRTWIQQFHVDCFGYSQDGGFVANQLSELARLPREARGMFLLFKGSEFVSFAGYGGATANTLRIIGVFTRGDFRGHGYGQLAAWCACRHLLTPVADHGLGRSAVALAADQTKSSVMGIYKRLGFAETTEFREYVDHEGLKAVTAKQ